MGSESSKESGRATFRRIRRSNLTDGAESENQASASPKKAKKIHSGNIRKGAKAPFFMVFSLFVIPLNI